MRNNFDLINQANIAMKERLNDPKNVVKGNFPTDINELFFFAMDEMRELAEEVKASKWDYERIASEAADAMNYLAMIIKSANEQCQ